MELTGDSGGLHRHRGHLSPGSHPADRRGEECLAGGGHGEHRLCQAGGEGGGGVGRVGGLWFGGVGGVSLVGGGGGVGWEVPGTPKYRWFLVVFGWFFYKVSGGFGRKPTIWGGGGVLEGGWEGFGVLGEFAWGK